MIRTELLAPARDLECGIAAVNSGADAVYIGGSGFSARLAASTPAADIARLCDHARRFSCRVYLAINTLLRENEIRRAVALARTAADAGVDAFIIQDMGLLEAGLPPLPLIASTQCHNDTPEKVLFLEKAGFSRAILARELSLEEIAAIRRAVSIELECFVHGSLCWAWSGRCWLSHSLGGRSGNRGDCGQPCRLPWELTGIIRDSHLLSLRDLNLSDRLADLLDAGVTSFKIEGRLKGPDYVKNVTSHYRKALDSLLDGRQAGRSSSGLSEPGFIPDPDKTFNRGYTRYFIGGRAERIFSMDTPKMKGSPVCVALSVDRQGFVADSVRDLRPADGLCWFDRSGALAGSAIQRIAGNRVLLRDVSGLRKGAEIFRNSDSVYLAALEKARPRRTIAVDWTIRKCSDGVTVTATDEDGIEAAELLPASRLQPADDGERGLSAWTAAFGRLGGTEFRSQGVRFDGMGPVFAPPSLLNAARRNLVESLRRARLSRRPGLRGGREDPSWPFPEKDLSFETGVLNSLAEKFYRKHGVLRIERAPESGLAMAGRRIARSRACPLKELGHCGRGTLFILTDPKGRRLELRTDCGKCEVSVYLPPEEGR